eukprot:scaffold87431_cov66-Phaeocystis_antarctica.AAC.1
MPLPRHHAPQRRLCRASAPPELPGLCRRATTRCSSADTAPPRHLTSYGSSAAPLRAAAPYLPRLCCTT